MFEDAEFLLPPSALALSQVDTLADDVEMTDVHGSRRKVLLIYRTSTQLLVLLVWHNDVRIVNLQ